MSSDISGQPGARVFSTMEPNSLGCRAFARKVYAALIKKNLPEHLLAVIESDKSFGLEHVPYLINVIRATHRAPMGQWDATIRTLCKTYDFSM